MEVAAQNNEAAAVVYCMYHGFNGSTADPGRARAMYEDMVEHGYSHQLYMNPMDPEEVVDAKKKKEQQWRSSATLVTF